MKMKTTRKPIEEIQQKGIQFYYPDYEIREEDMFLSNDLIVTAKQAIESLRPIEKKIFMVYIVSGTYSGVAKYFGVTPPTAASYINNLKTKIIKYINNNTKETDKDVNDDN